MKMAEGKPIRNTAETIIMAACDVEMTNTARLT
jgi:hypothetical protein